jgi:hypothetical protein
LWCIVVAARMQVVPNIKPAYDYLIAQGFKNTKVLELPDGIKPDWVAKGIQQNKKGKV